MAQALIIVGAVALDWGIAWLVWQGLVRILGRELPSRLSAVMPWVLLQLFIVAGLVVTGSLARATNSALLLTAVPLALFAAFFALPMALFRARGGTAIDLRICLDHTYATVLVWLGVLVMGVVL
ncbi:MAG: hypothetical protein ACRDJL_12280 [Actinomycetota bacterium]